jgi:hypothetical protein
MDCFAKVLFFSISSRHRSNTTYWSLLSEQGWVDEMVGMRTIISNFANIPESDITGNFLFYYNFESFVV